jgi:predicted nucleotide-binding protein
LIVPTEFSHIANAMAVAAGKPLLVLRDKEVAARGSLKEGYVHPVVTMPREAGPEWLATNTFEDAFERWLKAVREHKHVFLGYSGKAKGMASTVAQFLVGKLGLSVLDWHDSPASALIIQNIADAERLTMCGVFLFTRDDAMEYAGVRQDFPRDNVVYEAGYFAGAKGPRFTLIIREQGAKLPTDPGGLVYLELTERSDLSPIETKLREYFEAVSPKE